MGVGAGVGVGTGVGVGVAAGVGVGVGDGPGVVVVPPPPQLTRRAVNRMQVARPASLRVASLCRVLDSAIRMRDNMLSVPKISALFVLENRPCEPGPKLKGCSDPT